MTALMVGFSQHSIFVRLIFNEQEQKLSETLLCLFSSSSLHLLLIGPVNSGVSSGPVNSLFPQGR